MTSSKFDIEYNKWLRQVDVEDDDSVWGEIEYELDFIETWDNISARLDEIKPQKSKVVAMKYLKIFAAAAAIILLMFLPVKYFIEKAIQPSIISKQNNEVEQRGELITDEAPPVKKEKKDMDIAKIAEIEEIELPAIYQSYKKPSTYFLNNELTTLIDSIDTQDKVLNNEEIVFDRIQSRQLDAGNFLVSSVPILPDYIEKQTSIISEPGKASGVSFSVVDIGLVYGYKNTWLLNYETFNGLNPSKLGNSLPTFHQDIGATSTLAFNNRHLFGLEFFWKSETGQNYQQYINASFGERNIKLDYRKLQAYYIWDKNRIPGQAMLGGYIAKLTLAEEQLENAIFRVDDNYRNLDYGILAGYQFNIDLRNKIIIKPGVRVNYNLINIFEGDDIIPGHLKKTKNFAASFNISISYKLFN